MLRLAVMPLLLFVSFTFAAPSTAQSSSIAYRINPGDEVEILVWGDERLQRVVRILPDGTFAFPLVGQVAAAGKLP
jgi:polysaccharide export outer membrane protein